MSYSSITPEYLDEMVADELTSAARWLEIALLCSHECPITGLFALNEESAVRLTGHELSSVRKAIHELQYKHRIRIEKGFIFIYGKWANRTNQFSAKAYAAAGYELNKVPPDVRRLFFQRFPEFSKIHVELVITKSKKSLDFERMSDTELYTYLGNSITQNEESDRKSNTYGTPEYFQKYRN